MDWFVDILCTLAKSNTEVYLEPSRTSTMELFAKIVNGFEKHCAGVSSIIKLLVMFKKQIPVQVFSSEFCENFKNTFLRNTSVRLLQDRIKI